MKEIFTMWRHTRMIVFVAITAALYAAILIPFKVMVIIPSFTEVRPGIVVPMICAIFFGPAAAWGAGFGNVIGDVFGGGFGLGSIFGFVGNWAFGFIPYALWKALAKREPPLRSASQWAIFLLIAVVSSAACGGIVAWGCINAMGLLPPSLPLGLLILANNTAISVVLAPILLALLYPRLKKRGSLYTQIMPETRSMSAVRRLVGTIITCYGAVALIVFGSIFSAHGVAPVGPTVPFIAALFAGMALL
jgi:energy-coupling factor transport system substrate-specific component